MADPHPVDSPTVRAHKRQRTWQIILPIVVMTALIAAAAVLTVAGGASRTRAWADVSIIWLIIPMLVFALIFLTILIAIIFGVAKLTQVTPRLTARVQQLAARAASGTQHVADGAVKPFIWLQQAGAVIKSLLKPRS